MAVKTFTTGEVLTASDTNTYLNNGGLVYIAGTTVTSSSPYVEFLNCFSATYDNYRIVVNNLQVSSSGTLVFYFGTNSTSGLFYGSSYYDQYTGSSTGTNRRNGANSAYMGLSDSGGANGGYSFDLNAPFLTKQKTFHGTYDGRNYSGWFGGLAADSASYTGIRFLNDSGNVTAGTFRIYGYRQA